MTDQPGAQEGETEEQLAERAYKCHWTKADLIRYYHRANKKLRTLTAERDRYAEALREIRPMLAKASDLSDHNPSPSVQEANDLIQKAWLIVHRTALAEGGERWKVS